MFLIQLSFIGWVGQLVTLDGKACSLGRGVLAQWLGGVEVTFLLGWEELLCTCSKLSGVLLLAGIETPLLHAPHPTPRLSLSNWIAGLGAWYWTHRGLNSGSRGALVDTRGRTCVHTAVRELWRFCRGLGDWELYLHGSTLFLLGVCILPKASLLKWHLCTMYRMSRNQVSVAQEE